LTAATDVCDYHVALQTDRRHGRGMVREVARSGGDGRCDRRVHRCFDVSRSSRSLEHPAKRHKVDRRHRVLHTVRQFDCTVLQAREGSYASSFFTSGLQSRRRYMVSKTNKKLESAAKPNV